MSNNNNRDTNEITSSRIAHAAILQFNEPSSQNNQPSNPSSSSPSKPGACRISGTIGNNRPPPARTAANLVTANIVPQAVAVPIENDRNLPASYDISFNDEQEFIVDSLDQLVRSCPYSLLWLRVSYVLIPSSGLAVRVIVRRNK